MIVLAVEIYIYKRKSPKGIGSPKKTGSMITAVQPYKIYDSGEKEIKHNSILLGHGDFVPAKNKQFLQSFSN